MPATGNQPSSPRSEARKAIIKRVTAWSMGNGNTRTPQKYINFVDFGADQLQRPRIAYPSRTEAPCLCGGTGGNMGIQPPNCHARPLDQNGNRLTVVPEIR
jgi:hypothetical protein